MTREWNGSLVMEEFAKIAAEGGLITTDFGKPVMGNPDKETPVKDHRRYEPDKEYGVTKETGEDLVGKAHPKDAKPAQSMGEGALVENIVQQQEKDIEIATRMPSGALVGKHAELVNLLVALANDLDSAGKAEAATRIDMTIKRIAAWPFMTALFAPLKWVIWGGTTAGALGGIWYALGTKLTSIRESLSEDIQDLVEVASSVGEEPSLAALGNNIRKLMTPYVAKFRRPVPAPGQEDELRRYLGDIDSFGQDLPKVVSMVDAMTATPDVWYKFGFGAKSRLKEKLSDVQKDFAETMVTVKSLADAGRRKMEEATTPAPEAAKVSGGASDIAEIQGILAERGLRVPQTGKLDEATRTALRQLEKRLDADLRSNPKVAAILELRGWDIVGSILKPDGTVMDPSLLRRLLAITGK